MEIKSLQVPGERAQSAERAEERRRDKRFPFKLIPLRPSRFPSQDLQKAIKIWPCGSDEKLGGKKAKKKDCFDEGGREALKELVGRGGLRQRSRLRQIKGRRERREGWARPPRAHPGIALCASRSRAGHRYQPSNLCYTSDDGSTNPRRGGSLSRPGPW